MSYVPNQPQQPSTPSYQPSGEWTPTAPSSNGYKPTGYKTTPPTNVLAIWSLTLSIAGAVFLWYIGPIGGIVTGHMSLGQIRATGDGGKGMAIAGLVVGYISLLFQLAFVLFFVFVLATVPWEYLATV